MKWFNRKPTILHHDLRSAGTSRYYKNFYSAVRCEACGKQFIMDVFGGWSVEYEYTFDEVIKGFPKVNDDDFQKAMDKYHEAGVKGWTQLGYTDVCSPVLIHAKS